MKTKARGVTVLRDPHLNKSTAFTEAEREALGLLGLVPECIETGNLRVQRVLMQLASKPSNLERLPSPPAGYRTATRRSFIGW